MTRLISALFLVLILPGLAVAQTVQVRSGEHGGFTRVVLDIPPDTGWSANLLADRIRVTLDLSGAEFELSDAFDRITDDRVSAIQDVPGVSAVDILLSCPCGAEAFVLRNQMLVLDINTANLALGDQVSQNAPPPVLAAASPVPNTAAESEPEQPAQREPANMTSGAVNLARLGGFSSGFQGASQATNPLLPGFQVATPGAAQPMPMPQGGRDAQTDGGGLNDNAFGQALIANLARAATQGVLDPTTQSVDSLTALANQRSGATSGSSEQTMAGADSPLMADTEEDPAVRALREALDTMSTGGTRDARVSVGSTGCVPDSALSIRSWAAGEDGFRDLQRQRTELFSELDRLDPDAALDHAKGLIHMGFGAEARLMLDLVEDRDTVVLEGLSHLVDGRQDPKQTFLGQTGCDTAAALWAVLTPRTIAGDTLVDTGAVLRSFEALPTHLREHLGDTLADRLSMAGYDGAARDVLRRLERMHGGVTPEVSLATAKLDVKEGRFDIAGAAISELADEPGPETVEAVLSSIDLSWRRGAPVAPHIAGLAEAYGKEFGTSEEGALFWRARIRVNLLEGQTDTALGLFQNNGAIDEESRLQTADELVQGVTERASDVNFLKYATMGNLPAESLQKRALAIPYAERLLDLGMPDLAYERLASLPSNDAGDDLTLLQARALLGMDRPDEAEVLLFDLESDEAKRLRAEARVQMGDYAFAQSLFDQLGDTENSREAAWLSSDWDTLEAGAPDDPLARAAGVALSDTFVPRGQDFTLGALEQLSDASAASRSALEALLEETRIDPE